MSAASLLSGLCILLLLPLALLVALFALQVALSMFAPRAPVAMAQRRPRLALLVPAHDEQAGIAATLAQIIEQLGAGDRVLVVADNCSDDTAAIARACGAEVIERADNMHRGKGYALDAGVRQLALAPPDVLVIVDADCLLSTGALAVLAGQCAATRRPAQAMYLMQAPPGASLRIRMAEFAWAVKNQARARGMHRVGLPCQLTGSGMALPWDVVEKVELANGQLVEDLQLGLQCARAGFAPQLCPQALVSSRFPLNTQGLKSQRMRWEHGHMGMIVKQGLPLLLRGLRRADGPLCALSLDLCVPPLSLLCLLVVAACAIGAGFWWASGMLAPLCLSLLLVLSIGVAVLCAWTSFGRRILRLRELAFAPIYMLMKIPLYLKFFVRRQVDWVRSQRDQA